MTANEERRPGEGTALRRPTGQLVPPSIARPDGAVDGERIRRQGIVPISSLTPDERALVAVLVRMRATAGRGSL